MNDTLKQTEQTAVVMTPDEFLAHWQGHRTLTRRVIEAFPEKELFAYSIGGMRPFAGLAMELLGIAVPGLREIVTGEPSELSEKFDHGDKKENILKKWDESTDEINALWAQMKVERFHDKIKAFGMYEGTVLSSLQYFVDNEIHHRGQGYVYLRGLGIEPPAFWER
jgi:uncharacterized damage-inducible protein DinB